MKLNPKGVSRANSMIAAGHCDDSSAWSFSADDGNRMLGSGGDDWAAYGSMHLGVDDSQPVDTKAHYGYPFGKGGKVYVSALRAIRSRAAQQGADDIYKAAGTLLDKCEPGRAGGHMSSDEEHETKRLKVVFDETKFSDAGTFSGYAAIFGNVDYGGDVIERGAFAEMDKTKDGMVRVFYQHNPLQPIGKAHVAQDERGLRFDGQLLLSTSKGRDAHEQMKFGILDGMSIGYDVLPGGSEMMSSGVRSLKSLKLWEISPVTFGMNALARIESVKARTRKEFERFLREEGGFSRTEAKRIAARGFGGSDQRDVGADVEEVVQRISKLGNAGGTPSGLAALVERIKSL